MDERRKFLLTIVAGLVGLFFLCTHLYLPIAKDNAQLRTQSKQLKVQVKAIERFNQDELGSLENRLDAHIFNLESRIPVQGELKLVEQLTQVPVDTNIVFTEITHKMPQEMEGYQVLPVDVQIKASFYDFIKYLAGIETGPSMIGVDSLSLQKLTPEAKSLDIKVTFLGFRLIYQFPPISKYLEERYKPLEQQRLEKLFAPVESMDSASAVLRLKSYNPFIPAYDFAKKDGKTAYPPRKTIGIGGLSLNGILRIGEEKVALINDRVLREGEEIAGMQVVEIQDYQVVLMQSGRRFILKMGVDDEFIQP